MTLFKILILLFSYFYVINSLTCRNVSGSCPNGQEMCGQWSGYCGTICEKKEYVIVCAVCDTYGCYGNKYSGCDTYRGGDSYCGVPYCDGGPNCKYIPGICLMPSIPCPVGSSCSTICINGIERMTPISNICCHYSG
jgi:hypothetical protein